MFASIAEWFELSGEADIGLPGAVLRREAKETEVNDNLLD